MRSSWWDRLSNSLYRSSWSCSVATSSDMSVGRSSSAREELWIEQLSKSMVTMEEVRLGEACPMRSRFSSESSTTYVAIVRFGRGPLTGRQMTENNHQSHPNIDNDGGWTPLVLGVCVDRLQRLEE
eukprot:TCALIF_08687-PB protein Name:"Protein of unknown function" AED:0.42 eAED:1.00 QI:0/0/0/1/0/0/2/0/125